MLENWRWRLPLWTETDRRGFRDATAEAWHLHQLYDPDIRTKAFRKYSPHTYDTREEWELRELRPGEPHVLNKEKQ